MIRFIAALDSKRGIADDNGIPWNGQIPADVEYYCGIIQTGDPILMGYGLYREISFPYKGGPNFVATRGDEALRPGFERVSDAREFLMKHPNSWNLGGAMLFESTFDLAEELYLAHIEADFDCTKFFPDYENDFELLEESEAMTENGLTFRFARYVRRGVDPTPTASTG